MLTTTNEPLLQSAARKHWTSRTFDVLRWVAVLPGAALGAVIASGLTVLINRWTAGAYVDVDSFLFRAWVVTIQHQVLAWAFVCGAAFIAPQYRRNVAFAATAVCILASGFALFPAVQTQAWWSVYAGVITAIGGGAAGWTVYSGDLDFV